MDNQHQKISGYRNLTQAEIDLINEAKALEAQLLKFHSRVGLTLKEQYFSSLEEGLRQDASNAEFWHKAAKNDFETGFMALVRSIAQPQPQV